MNQNEEFGILAGFTTLAPLAVGGLVGLLVARGLDQEAGLDRAAFIVLAVGILALVVSLLHLGRPWRAPLALIRLSTSWLSREVILFGLFLLTLGCYAILPALHVSGLVREAVGRAGAIIGLISTVATGETYRLRARPSWDHWLTVVTFPLGARSTGSLFGFFVVWQLDAGSQVPGYAWAATAALLTFSLVVTWQRSIRSPLSSMEAGISRQLVFGTYRWLLAVRLVAVVLAITLIGMGRYQSFFAWIPAMLGEFADRLLFFRTVVPVTLRRRYI